MAEAYDRRTRAPGLHGGQIKRTGLAVLRALLCRYIDLRSGRCDPSADAIALAAGVSRSTVFTALDRLEVAGLVQRYQRLATYKERGIWHTEQTTNAYAFNFPADTRPDEGDLAAPLFDRRAARRPWYSPESRNQPGTSTSYLKGGRNHGDLTTGQ